MRRHSKIYVYVSEWYVRKYKQKHTKLTAVLVQIQIRNIIHRPISRRLYNNQMKERAKRDTKQQKAEESYIHNRICINRENKRPGETNINADKKGFGPLKTQPKIKIIK